MGVASQRGFHANWEDYDNDGDLDLYVVMLDPYPNKLYRNEISEGNGFVETGEMADTQIGSGGSWGDFDADGDLDYFLVCVINRNAATYRLYQNNVSENGNHWLQLNLIGTVSNRSAIGATIYIKTGGLVQMRHIASYSNISAQNTFPVAFGLGKHATVDTITIKWPSGIEQVLENVAVDQLLTVTEAIYCPDSICHVSTDGSNETGDGSEAKAFATIQHGIDVAKDGYTILVHPGTYVENINFNGKNIIVKSTDGAENTVIDGSQSGSVVKFANEESEKAILTGFTLTNGNGTLLGGYTHGGGIYVKNANPTIENMVILNNSVTSSGGGIPF
ncbi:Integrin alpha chain [Beggiatoa sp. SS]|nr:Integrin alpha chain [Beggiatoa sp. SS]